MVNWKNSIIYSTLLYYFGTDNELSDFHSNKSISNDNRKWHWILFGGGLIAPFTTPFFDEFMRLDERVSYGALITIPFFIDSIIYKDADLINSSMVGRVRENVKYYSTQILSNFKRPINNSLENKINK